MKNKLAVFLCFIMICQVVIAGDFAGWESVDSYAVTGSQSDEGAGIVEEAFDETGIFSGGGQEDTQENVETSENIGLLEADETLFGDWENEDNTALEVWDENDPIELSEESHEVFLFSDGEEPWEENSDFEVEASQEEANETKDGIYYSYYINPVYQDVLTESDLPSIPEGVWEDSSVQAGLTENFTDVLKAGEYMRAKMVDREAVIALRLTIENETVDHFDNAKLDEYRDKITNEAWRHTGNPIEGDYISRHVFGFASACTMSQVGNDVSLFFAFFFRVEGTSKEQEEKVTARVNELKSQWDFSNASDFDKILTIYDYVCSNVSYDYLYEHGGAYDGLIGKLVVCNGYGALMYRLLLEEGIDCRAVCGSSHVWNICRLGNLYYCLDATWDAGRKLDTYKWFLKGSENGLTGGHTPYRDYDDAFWAEYPVSAKDYSLPEYATPTPTPIGGRLEKGVDWTLDNNGNLSVKYSGEGEAPMDDYPYNKIDDRLITKAPWGTDIRTVEFLSGVTSTGTYAFAGCENILSAKFNSASSLKNISYGSFYGCKRLTSVDLSSCENIKELEEWAFGECSNLKSIVLPSGLENIEGAAFYNCSRLTDIDLKSVKQIGNYAFDYCRYLRNVSIPESVTSIGKYAFCNCNSISEIELPHSLSLISEGVFRGCSSLRKVTIPDSVKSIGKNAFYNCSSLKTIFIPSTVTAIESNAFYNCNELTIYGEKGSVAESYANDHQINFQETDTYQKTKIVKEGTCGSRGDEGENVKWTLDNEGTLVLSGIGDMKTYFDYNSPQTILDNPWQGDVKNLIVEYGVTNIGGCAFYNCSNLESVKLPNSIGRICFSAFRNCTKLKTFEVPENVIRIENRAFQDATGLTDVVFQKGVTYIGSHAFQGCSNLKRVVLPETLEYIQDHAFKECDELTTINIPNGVKYIGDAAFYSCDKLASINIPEEVTRIEKWTFGYCSSLTNMMLPEGIEYIGDLAYYGCSSLKNINLPDDIYYIGDCAFVSCKSFSNIVLPKGLKEIKKEIFRKCVNLQSVIVRGNPSIENVENVNPFYECPKLTIYAESGTYIETYAKENNISFKLLSEYPGGLPTPKPTNTPSPTPKPTNTPSPTPKPTNTLSPTPRPTNTPKPTNTPRPTPTPELKITLNKTKITLYADNEDLSKLSFDTVQLTAKANRTGEILFKSNNTSVADVEAETGIIHPKKKGTATITAYMSGYRTGYATCIVKVKKSSVKVTPKKVSLKVGKEKTLTCKFTPSKGKLYYVDWSKCNGIINCKLNNGIIILKGIKKGKGTLEVTWGACKKAVKVTVK